MYDTSRCMHLKAGESIGGARCQEVATHETLLGRRCAWHADELKKAFRDPRSVGNVLAGGVARTEEQIERLVVKISGERS